MKNLIATFVLAAASGAATAAPLWVDNESFGFEACASAVAAPDAGATLAALRADAEAQLRRAGTLAAGRQVLLTPVAGRFACGAQASQMTLRVVVVDAAGTYRNSELIAAAAPASQTALAALSARR